MKGTRTPFELAAIATALAMIAYMVWVLLGADGLLLASGQPMFGDFIAFWSGGSAALDGRALEAHDRALIARYHQAAVPGVAYVAAWTHPPTFLLVAAALATLPYPVAAALFLAGSATVYFYAARKILPDRRSLIFAMTLPAAVYHLGTVQTGLLLAGATALALHWLDRRPLAAGALVSVLAIKPHLAILWPLLLALSGRWRAFAAAAACTTAFVLAAGLAFGFEPYARFLANLGPTQTLISDLRVTTPAYASLYANLLQLGAAQSPAVTIHAASAVAALALAVWIFRTPAELRVQGAALTAATLIVLPYVFFYDFTLLAVGAALLGAPRDRLEILAIIFAWSAGLSLALGYVAPLPLCPLAAWLVLIAAFRRGGIAAARPAPAPQM